MPWEAISQATGLLPRLCLCLCVSVSVCVCVWAGGCALCLAVGLLEKDTIVAEEAWKFGKIWFCLAFPSAPFVFLCVVHPLCIHPSISSIISVHS